MILPVAYVPKRSFTTFCQKEHMPSGFSEALLLLRHKCDVKQAAVDFFPKCFPL